jgi:hypothetical protein
MEDIEEEDMPPPLFKLMPPLALEVTTPLEEDDEKPPR